jgi:hypothetical protein
MVNSAYIDRSFFRTMLAMAALDIILLFWILNPLARPSKSLLAWHRVSPPVQQMVVVNAAPKPSPLGGIPKHLTPGGSPSARRFVTVAYRQ